MLWFLWFVQNMFAVHGDLAHVKVVYDRSTGKSMGYGFVKFTTNEAAAAATAAINGMAIERKRIKVRTKSRSGERAGGAGRSIILKPFSRVALPCCVFLANPSRVWLTGLCLQ